MQIPLIFHPGSSAIFKRIEMHSTLNYNFDRIFWVDSLWRQKIKGQVSNDDALFTDVSARNYFKVFKNNNAYYCLTAYAFFFGLEPVNSWADGNSE